MEGIDYPLSERLGALLDKHKGDVAIDLRMFAVEIERMYPMPERASEMPLAAASGTIAYGTLFRHMFDFVCYDSVVRDIMTVGHLGKLLSRFDVYREIQNPRIFALPNRIFDAWSQKERAEFFQNGNILPIEAEVLQIASVINMLDRERPERGQA